MYKNLKIKNPPLKLKAQKGGLKNMPMIQLEIKNYFACSSM
jgi:hypothetical protein